MTMVESSFYMKARKTGRIGMKSSLDPNDRSFSDKQTRSKSP